MPLPLHVHADLVHPALRDLARAEREGVSGASPCEETQDLDMRPRDLPVRGHARLLANGLQALQDRLADDFAVRKADVQLPDIVPVEALPHLLPGGPVQAHEHRAARLSVEAVTEPEVLVLVEEAGVEGLLPLVHELEPPVDVLLLAVAKLLVLEIVENLEAHVLQPHPRIQLPADALLHVCRRADPAGRLVDYEDVLPPPEQRGHG
mmetsp:Transcript_25676/g.76610  ORF Transcript_25676/g.76610 Transcript_25676/m.76610 type:complete len:207 (+) Transcript_25676:134-754(+)